MRFLIIIWSVWCFVITFFLFMILLPFNLFLIFVLGEIGRKLFVQYNFYVANILLFLFGMVKDVKGYYPINIKTPCIYMVNHRSYLDVIIVASLIRQKIKYLGKAEVFDWPLFGFLAKHSGQIPVQRENKESRQKGYDLMKKAIEEGFSIILFPEGGWKNRGDKKSSNPYGLSEDKLLQDFRNGGFRLAMETKVPIVPIILLNAQIRFSDLTMRIIPGKIKVYVLDIMSSKAFKTPLDLNKECHKLMLTHLKEF